MPGAVVQPDPCMPETLEEGLGFALAVKGGDGKDKPSSSQGRVRAALPVAALHHSPRAAAHTESSTAHAMILFFNAIPPICYGSAVFLPEQAAGSLEQQPGVHAFAAQLEVHGQLFAQRAHSLPLFHGLALADRNLLQAVQIAAQPAAVVDDHRIAGKRQIARKHHRALAAARQGAPGMVYSFVELERLPAGRSLL